MERLSQEASDPLTLKAGLARIGSSFESAVTFDSHRSSASLEVPLYARDLGYNKACSSFIYLSSRNYRM